MRKKYILLAIFIYTIFPFTSVFMKYASMNNNLFMKFVLFSCSIVVLGIFSILWQNLLKHTDLVKAYIFKSTTIIWNIIYGIILFNEKLTINMIIGMILTTIGVIISILGDRKND